MDSDEVIDGRTGEITKSELKYVDVAVFDASDYALSMDKTQRNLSVLRKFVQENFADGVDYGAPFPGSPKNSLLLPGAEKFNLLFNVYPQFVSIEHVTDQKTGFCLYHLGCKLINKETGKTVGYGEGSCNVFESKFRYRNGERLCPNCGKATIIKGKAEYGGGWVCFAKKGGCGHKFQDGDESIESQQVGKVENDNFFDLWNNILKYAEKRAMVCAVVYTGGVSELFTQDGDDYADNESAKSSKTIRASVKTTQGKKIDSDKAPDGDPFSGQDPNDIPLDDHKSDKVEVITLWDGKTQKPANELVDITNIEAFTRKFVGKGLYFDGIDSANNAHLKNYLRKYFQVDSVRELTWRRMTELVIRVKEDVAKKADEKKHAGKSVDPVLAKAKELGAVVTPAGEMLTVSYLMTRADLLECKTLEKVCEGVFQGVKLEQASEDQLKFLNGLLDAIDKGNVGANDLPAQLEALAM